MVILNDNKLSLYLLKDWLHLNMYGTHKLAENFNSMVEILGILNVWVGRHPLNTLYIKSLKNIDENGMSTRYLLKS